MYVCNVLAYLYELYGMNLFLILKVQVISELYLYGAIHGRMGRHGLFWKLKGMRLKCWIDFFHWESC